MPHVPGLPLFPPCCLAPLAALSTLGKWVRTASHPQRDSRHFAPCKERWETWHQGPSSCAALQSPPRLPAPCQSPDCLSRSPQAPLESLSPTHCPTPPPSTARSTTGFGLGGNMVGQQQGLPPTSPSAPLARAANASIAPPSRTLACPQAGVSHCPPASGMAGKEHFGAKGLLWAPRVPWYPLGSSRPPVSSCPLLSPDELICLITKTSREHRGLQLSSLAS